MKAELTRLLDNFDVISFDIFDTLLLRPFVKPTDLFRKMERDEKAKGFADDRIRAEKEAREAARTKGREEVSLDDIYAVIPQWMEMRPKELVAERKHLVANATMLEVWNDAKAAGKKVVITSDMYLPASFLKDVLHENGINGWDGFFLSCERQATKAGGKLYKCIIDDLETSPERVLHIGDNPLSDVERAHQQGIQTFFQKSPLNVFLNEHRFARSFLLVSNDVFSSELVGRLAIVWNKRTTVRPEPTVWERLGFLFGGFLGVSYLSFVVKTARKEHLDTLLFVARDGWLMEQVFHLMAPDIETHYVYAPRKVAASDDPEIWNEYREYVASLNLGEKNVGVVDSNTIHFSSQKLFSKALGKSVFGIFAVAFRPVLNGDCFCFSPNRSLRWPNFLEFLFMAPTPPVVAVQDRAPVYLHPISTEEQRRIDVYPAVAHGALLSAEVLLNAGIIPSLQTWMDWFDAFAAEPPKEVWGALQSLRHGEDPSHAHLVSVITDGPPNQKWRKKYGIPLVLRRRFRRGLKLISADYFLGIVKFRELEGDF